MCSFDITITEGADSFVAKVKSQVESNNGTFTGDASSGSFDVPIPLGHISGTYTIAGSTVSIIITHKGLIGCDTIANYIRSHV